MINKVIFGICFMGALVLTIQNLADRFDASFFLSKTTNVGKIVIFSALFGAGMGFTAKALFFGVKEVENDDSDF